MYSKDYLANIVIKVLARLDVPVNDGQTVADVLLAAELRDIPSHGMLRLPDYARLLEEGRINPKPYIKTTHETLSTAVIDGDSGLGAVVSVKAMKKAIDKAIKAGTGWVAVKDSNHFGIASYFSMMALEYDMTGVSMTNSNPLVAPTFSKSRLLGTNPVSVAIPAGKQPPFVADMATSVIARGKLQVKQNQGESIHHGYVQDANGDPSNNPGILVDGGAILPLGSSYEYGSHKGYCLAAAIDIFSGIFSGAGFGPFVPPSVPFLSPPTAEHGKGTGHFFGAMSIDAFQPKEVFKQKMDEWIETFRKAKPAKGHDKVLIPGDPEREAEIKNKNNPIKLSDKVASQVKEICKRYDINFEY